MQVRELPHPTLAAMHAQHSAVPYALGAVALVLTFVPAAWVIDLTRRLWNGAIMPVAFVVRLLVGAVPAALLQIPLAWFSSWAHHARHTPDFSNFLVMGEFFGLALPVFRIGIDWPRRFFAWWRRKEPRGVPGTPRPHRGTWLRTEAEVTALWRKRFAQMKGPEGTSLASLFVPLGNSYISPQYEAMHTQIVGVSGSGKSTAIKHILGQVYARPGSRAIIVDPDGGYAAQFYDPARGDLIFNPFDARAACWNLFADIRQPYHAEQIAASLIPEGVGEAAQWQEYAQQFTTACIQRLRIQKPDASIGDLWRAVSMDPIGDLRVLLENTPAAPFLERDNERFFGSVRSTAVGAMTGLSYLAQQAHGAQLSLVDYATDDTRKGWLFITYQPDQLAALKGVIAAMLRVLIFSTMSRTEGDAGLWFVIDELDAIGKIDGLKDALPRLRKFGGRCVLSFQSIGALNALYGPEFASVLVENCANKLILRCAPTGGTQGAGGTSAYAAALLGKREVLKKSWQETTSIGESSGGGRGGGHFGQNQSTSQGATTSYVVEDTVLPSEIESMPPLEGLVHTVGCEWWSWCHIAPFDTVRRAPAFVAYPVNASHENWMPTPDATAEILTLGARVL